MSTAQVAKASQAFDKASQISQSFLSEIENNGKMPSPLKLLTLSRLYGITLAEIYRVLGASDEEMGVHFEASLAERRLYPNPRHRHIHRQVQHLADSGLHEPLEKLADEFQILIDEQRASMLEVIRENQPDAACVLAGRCILAEYRLSDRERRRLEDGWQPDGSEWHRFTEGGEDDFLITLYLKNPELKEPIKANVIVPMVRWRAGYKRVIRRLRRRS